MVHWQMLRNSVQLLELFVLSCERLVVVYCLFKIIWKKWSVPLFIILPNQKWDTHEVVPNFSLRNSKITVGLLILGQFPHVSLQRRRNVLLLAGEGVNHICYKKTFRFVTSKDGIPFEIILTTPDREPEIRLINLSSNQHARNIPSRIYA